ncbi:MAG: Rne/Rng family ribonuclease [Desulfomonile tiedjei]|uniref:Ribonuclease G n=1 Tax=Desulfomonile tiedjei TaxID=2358 RepID=A0A9D6Z5N7_9BACT|nr:Rne/Rng family ribonuclease [Desulfomonile tiedjei]
MSKKMLINASQPEECRVAVVCDGLLEELDVQVKAREATLGNIYKGVVGRIEPSLQAVFVDYGAERNGFLSINDVHPSYFPESFEGARRRPRIQDVFKKDDHVLVQVNKEERNTKGACLTTNVSMAGRYLVLMPGTDLYGVSRKIEDEKERKKLKEIVKQFKLPENMGFIIRTAGMGRTKTELARDLDYLLRLWESIEGNLAKYEAPVLLYREHDIVIRSIREHFSSDISEILVDEKDTHRKVREFFHQVMPKYENLVKMYQEKRPLFNKYQLEEQVEQVYRKRIRLKSGGYIIIEPTEALVTVDVNSGSATKEKGIEETAYRVNMEAAPEIARQLRLRDLGGIIVIDFIDMTQKKHKQDVEKAIKTILKTDRARNKILRISALGLLELSRQRLRSVLGTGEYTDCPMCDGQGRIKSPEMAALSVFRKIKSLLIKTNVSEVRATVPVKVGEYLLNRMRAALVEMESQYNARVTVMVKENLPEKDILVEALKEEAIQEPVQVEAIISAPTLVAEIASVSEEETLTELDQKKTSKSRQRRRRGRTKVTSENEEGIESGAELAAESEISCEEEAYNRAFGDEPAQEPLDIALEPAASPELETVAPQTDVRFAAGTGITHDEEFQTESVLPLEREEHTVAAEEEIVERTAQMAAAGQPEMERTSSEVSLPENMAAESPELPSDTEKKETKEKAPRKSLLQSYLPFS